MLNKILIILCLILFSACGNNEKNNEEIIDDTSSSAEVLVPEEEIYEEEVVIDEDYFVSVINDGQILFYSNNYGYRYGPSIIEYDDGSIDMWFSAPGNNRSQWDYITYRHSDDGINFYNEMVVLRPTPGSLDQCSACDPGVIYFNGYYYLAYTATDYYAGRGTNNSAFVARSEYPYGPFEKWNGEDWGGYPEPIIEYDGDPSGWGIGEVSFVIYEDELFIYYTYFDLNGGTVKLAKADLSENWPLTIEDYDVACEVDRQDSMDFVYVDDLKTFLGFSITKRMSDQSGLVMFASKDGANYEEVSRTNELMMLYAHNVGVSKGLDGHIKSTDRNVICYGYGPSWGKWSAIMQDISIEVEYKEKTVKKYER